MRDGAGPPTHETPQARQDARSVLAADPPIVDCHAHIFTDDLPMAASAWRRLDYGFSAEQYLATLDAHKIHFGVISGISISGYYNDYMIEQLRRFGRLRGTAILPPTTDRYTLDRMQADGIVGVRLQVHGHAQLPDLDSEEWRLLLRRIRDLDWHVHLALEGGRTPPVLAQLQASGVKLVIDHFGHPEPGDGPGCKGFQAILKAAQGGKVWVKLSSAYRLYRTPPGEPTPDARGEDMGEQLARVLLAEIGPERMLWGSDCPFVGFEQAVTYADAMNAFVRWVPSPRDRRIMSDTALKLYFS